MIGSKQAGEKPVRDFFGAWQGRNLDTGVFVIKNGKIARFGDHVDLADSECRSGLQF